MALLYLTVITPNSITISRWLGGGSAGDVYGAKIASLARGNAVVLKVLCISQMHCILPTHVFRLLFLILQATSEYRSRRTTAKAFILLLRKVSLLL
jgi:hypothetical protein